MAKRQEVAPMQNDTTTETTETETDDRALAALDTSGWIKQIDKSAFEGIVIERVHSLQEGQVIEGELLGRGQTLESVDEKTGEVRPINTHRVKVAPQLVVAILESHALRSLRVLPVGQRVRLIHLGFIRRGSRQIADVVTATVGDAPKGSHPDSRWTTPQLALPMNA